MKSASAEGIRLIPLPKLKKGELYVGAIIGPDGRGDHVVLLAGDQNDVTWSDAMAWAKKKGGDLPNRVEQALLFAHHKDKFEKRAYWSNAQHADESVWAWSQYFSYGLQYYNDKGNKLRARAVRRVPIR